jgi:hypothetical protein
MLALALVAALASPARAQAPADTTLEGYVRSMADSTDRWFGLSAASLDTTGLDSARVYWLEHPTAHPARRGSRLSLEPALGFNRVLGPAMGGEVSFALPRSLGRLAGRAQYASGARRWLGGGEWTRRHEDPATDATWSARVFAGRSCEALNRDFFDPTFASLYAFVSGSDRSHYLQRDGARLELRRATHSWWGGIGARDERESPLATTATWNLAHAIPVVVANDTATAGRVHEVSLHAGARLPHTPFSLDARTHFAGGSLGGDLAYTRLEAAMGGPIALGRHLALAPQAEYGRLTGSALPQDALYMGGGTLHTIDANSRQGTGRALARVDLIVTEPVQALLGFQRSPLFPVQVAVFAGSGATWGADPVTGRARLTRRDAPRASEWLSEAGASVMYRPGLPEPGAFLRLDYTVPIGPDDREPRLYFSYSAPLGFLRRR